MSPTLQRFSQPFDTTWFSGAPVFGNFVPAEFQCAIGGHGYLLDLSQYSRSTLPIRRQPMDDSIEPGEQSLSQEGVWRRGQDNLFLGAGQEYLDNRFTFLSVYMRNGENPSVRTRFWRSQGIDPWVEGTVSLLPENALQLAGGSGCWAINVAGYLYYWDGTTLRYSANPGPGTLTWATVTAPAGGWGTLASPTTDGNNLWMAAGTDGIGHTTAGAGSATFVRLTPTAPTVVANPTTGSTSYTYYLVGTDVNGFKTLPSLGTTITNGNASPNNTVTLPSTPGIISWDILRGTTSLSVGLAQTGAAFIDTNASPAAYVPPTATTDNLQADFLGYANGFLIGASGPLLVSIAVNGTTTLLWTHPNPNFRWRASGPSPMCIYLAGDGGGNSEIFATTLNSTTSGLSAPYLAGEVGNGELVRAMSYYEGLMILATSLGVRTAQDTQSNGHLTSGPVITDPGDTKCLAPWGPYCWFGWTDYDTNDGVNPLPATTSGTGRLSLSTYTTDPLLPAYASDVHSDLGTTGAVTSLAVIGGNVFFTIDGVGIYGPTGNLVQDGFFETGWIRYGLTQAKVLVAVDLRHDPLQGTVSIQCVPSNASTFLVGTSSVPQSVGPDIPFDAGSRVVDAFQLLFTLNRSTTDPTQGPAMHQWVSEALPIVTRQDQIIVPIMMGQTVTSPVREGQIVPYDPLAEFQYLKGLESAAAPVLYQEGAASYSCVVDQIEVKPKKWTDDFSFMEGLFLVKLLTLDIDQ